MGELFVPQASHESGGEIQNGAKCYCNVSFLSTKPLRNWEVYKMG